MRNVLTTFEQLSIHASTIAYVSRRGKLRLTHLTRCCGGVFRALCYGLTSR
jgi:hypothetical protein